MVINSHEHAIIVEFKKLDDYYRHRFLLLTKLIFYHQMKNKFILLKDMKDNYLYYNYFIGANFKGIKFNEDELYLLQYIYQTYDLFLEILSYISAINKITELPPMLNGLINEEYKPKFIKFINLIILFNLIQCRLIDKSHEDIIENNDTSYGLFQKLDNVGYIADCFLELKQLYNKNANNEYIYASVFNKNTFLLNYSYSPITSFIDRISEEQYDDIYNIFRLFI
jgi:hypothetical protein